MCPPIDTLRGKGHVHTINVPAEVSKSTMETQISNQKIRTSLSVYVCYKNVKLGQLLVWRCQKCKYIFFLLSSLL